jgi:hypothetical protein
MMQLPALPSLSDLPPASRSRGFRARPAEGTVFALPAQRLFEAWLAVTGRQPRTRKLSVDSTTRRSLHVQRTQWLRFPDLVRAEVVDLGKGRSGIAIDSRSRFGVFDFCVNRRRVKRWLAALAAEVQQVRGTGLPDTVSKEAAAARD